MRCITLNKSSFNCSYIGDNTITLTVTDKNGNSASATAIVTVVENIKPVVVARKVILQLDAAGIATLTASAVDNGFFDNYGITSHSRGKSK